MTNSISTRLVVLGSGPAGYTAAIYAARAGLSPVLIQGIVPGGQLTTTTDVENYPGFRDVIQGPWLMEEMQAQAEHVGTKVVWDHIASVDLSRQPFRAEKILQDRLFANPNIKVIWDSEVVEFVGGGEPEALIGLDIRNKRSGEVSRVEVEGAFVAIGHSPATELFKGQLDLDADGYIQVAPGSTRTSVEGVFACGDVMDKIYRQAVTAAGTGCMAALDAEKYLAAQEYEAIAAE